MAKSGRLAIVAMVASIALGACAAQFSTHGYTPRDEDLQQIVPGVDTRATVEDLVGVPSASGVLNAGGFYYIESRMRQYGWRATEVVDREVVAITFDQAGVVENITRYGLEDGNVVPITRRVTQTTDGELSFIRRLFGNIGGLSLSQFTNPQ